MSTSENDDLNTKNTWIWQPDRGWPPLTRLIYGFQWAMENLRSHTVKWKEPNRPQRPNRPQFLEGRFGTCWAVLDRKSQNSSRWYQFGPSNFWIGYTKSYFGTSSQFGPSDSQIKIPIWPQQGLLEATAFCRQKGRKETAVFGWSNHSHVWHNPKYGPFSRVRN